MIYVLECTDERFDRVVVIAMDDAEAIELASDAFGASAVIVASCPVSTDVEMEMGEQRPYVG